MNFTKDDFVSWRNNPVTIEFATLAIDEMNSSIKDLIFSAGVDSLEDRRRVGRIEGLKWLTDWVPEFEEDKDESTGIGA